MYWLCGVVATPPPPCKSDTRLPKFDHSNRGGPRGGSMGGWRRVPERLGAVTVGYKRH